MGAQPLNSLGNVRCVEAFSFGVQRFYFHLRDDLDVPDDEGMNFPALEFAREHAIQNVVFTAAETLKEQRKLVLDHRIDIEDDRGKVLDSVRIRDVVTIED